MIQLKENLSKRIAVASGKEPADTVIKNGKIIDVFNGEISTGDIAIVDGVFVGIGEYEGRNVIDAAGRYISPTFIDGHVHIESSMLTPTEFAKVLLSHGVSTVIADPHEIANVSGENGIQYMLDDSENLPFDFYFMLPSCVPATQFEHSGATLEASDLQPFYQHPRVLGLAEVMNYPAVLAADTDMLTKISDALKHGKRVDGHGAGLSPHDLNVYTSAHIRTDHESTTAEEAKERLRRGMYLMIREGTVAKDLKQLLPAVNERNSRRCLLVTDDKHLDDLIDEGSVDHIVRMAIKLGVAPITAIQMVTINAAECFGLSTKGAIAPGYQADFILLDDLETIKISRVYKDGYLVVEDGQVLPFSKEDNMKDTRELTNTVHFHEILPSDFQIVHPLNQSNIIEIIPNSLVTKHLIEKTDVCETGFFQPSTVKDQLKLAVIERHHMTGLIGLGIVKGFGFHSGAIATTIAHDSHNVVVAGTNDTDMAFAANMIRDMQGGLIVVKDQKVIASLSLSIAGLMSDQPYQKVNFKLNELNEALKAIGAGSEFNPFLTLSFLTLPVIPELKLTDTGLFKVSSFEHVEIGAN
ncbi:adenine deaminase [Bacillus yapensis]|uniref:adenine deaminase n=1 Tax=Bacillaceae TaxID=186817 RepID=UPI001FEBA69D|nr:adenine deaminase [Bacillus yapensis]